MKALMILTAMLFTGSVLVAQDAKPEEKPASPAQQARADMLKKYDKDGDGKLSEEERAAMRADRAKEREEMTKKREAENLKKYDKDGDGKLSEEERAAMRADREKERAARMTEREGAMERPDRPERPNRGARPDSGMFRGREGRPDSGMFRGREGRPDSGMFRGRGGDNAQTGERARQMRDDMMKRYDKDGDGVLSDEERAAMTADREKMRAERQTNRANRGGVNAGENRRERPNRGEGAEGRRGNRGGGETPPPPPAE